MKTRYVIQRDTRAWKFQVWAAFGISILACVVGVGAIPGDPTDRGFVAMGLVFSLFASFALAKTERDNRDGQVDTQGWVLAVWAAFGISLAITAWGLWIMPMEVWAKRYLGVSWLFLVSSAFTLSKTLRDRHEADLLEREYQAQRQAQQVAAAPAGGKLEASATSAAPVAAAERATTPR